MKVYEALGIAMRTNDETAWELAKRMAEVEIGRFALAMVRGIEAHCRGVAARTKALSGGYVVEPRH